MKTIKNKDLITPEYCTRLAKYIKENPSRFFAKENEAEAWCDFVDFPDKKTDRNHLILRGEVCIIDRVYNDRHAYMVCQFYGNCRKVRDLHFVLYIDELKKSDWRNGYFLIPNLDIKNEK